MGVRRNTKEQIQVIKLESGPARVLAGAGSGKTHTMTEFVARKVRDHAEGMGGVAPERILAITFTVKAAEEMRERLSRRVGDAAMKLTVSNFHRLAFDLARQNATALGIPQDAPVLRQARAWLMILDDLVSDDLSLKTLDLSNPATVAENTLRLLNQSRNELVSLDEIRDRTLRDIADERATEDMRRVFETRLDLVTLAERFEENRERLGLLQYQDMVETAVRVLRSPGMREAYRNRYDLVVVDEFQDTNPAQMRLVELLADGDSSKIVVIGDDLQSIFNFQGAAIRNIQNFEQWAKPRANGESIVQVNYSLTKNFRSATRILTLANHIAESVHPENSPDEPKVLDPRDDASDGRIEAFAEPTDVEEAENIAGRIRELVGEDGDYSTCAVLIRNWSQAEPVLNALSEAGIPCEVVRGGELLARPEVRYLTDFLRLVHEPGHAGEALTRTFSRRPYHMSDGDLRSIYDYPGGPWKAMMQTDSTATNISDEARDRLRRLRAVLSELEGDRSQAQTLSEFVERVVETTGLGREVRSSPENEARLAEHYLAAFREVASEFGEVEHLGEFLRYVEFSEGSRTSENAEPPEVSGDAVILTTIHRAKGLEFDHVFVPGLSASHFPNDNSRRIESPLKVAHRIPSPLKPDPDPDEREAYEAFDEESLRAALKREADEEEGRLFYVAATRAKETLVLSRAGFYTQRKKPKKAGAFWEITQDAPAACNIPSPEEPTLSDESPNLPVFGAPDPPDPDGFPLEATRGTMADEARIAEELGVTGYEEELNGLRIDIENIPEVERPEYVLPAPEVHSPSSLMEFEVCPRRYYYKYVFPVVEVVDVGGASRAHGDAWHRWIENGMEGEEPEFPKDEFSSDEFPNEETIPPDVENPPEKTVPRKPQSTFADNEYAKRVKSHPLHEGDAPPERGFKKMIEVPFKVEVGGKEIRGRMDAVFTDEDGTLHIIDWKSGKPNDSYKKRLQLPLYALAAIRMWDVLPENIRLAYVFPTGEQVEVPFDSPDETEEKIASLINGIVSGHFLPDPSEYACKYCPVFGIGIEGCPKDEEELRKMMEERNE